MQSISDVMMHIFRVSYDHGPEKRDWGTCYAYRTASGVRLVTAAHVFRKLESPATSLLTFAGVGLPLCSHLTTILYLTGDRALLECAIVPSTALTAVTGVIPAFAECVSFGFRKAPWEDPDEVPTASDAPGIVKVPVVYKNCEGFVVTFSDDCGPGHSGGPVLLDGSLEVFGTVHGPADSADVPNIEHPVVCTDTRLL